MTTTITLPTRDSIVVGCDSLATSTTVVMDAMSFVNKFFDANGLIEGSDGKPLLKSTGDIGDFSKRVPVNQMPKVRKLFDLKPLNASLLFAGASMIGSRSIKNIIGELRATSTFKSMSKTSYTMNGVAKMVSTHFKKLYNKEFPARNRDLWPTMEILLSGYSKRYRDPEVFRIEMGGTSPGIKQEIKRGNHWIIFGGQHDVIERVTLGIDLEGWRSLWGRSNDVLNAYRNKIQKHLIDQGVAITLPEIDGSDEKLQLFGEGFRLKGIYSDWASLSEQAAIDFVNFLVNLMIQSQEFSDSIPTVGGEIHVALQTKDDGFRWISCEEYAIQGHTVPKFED